MPRISFGSRIVMKIIERNDNRYVLEPLKQYLINNGIDAKVDMEWKSGRKYGPYVLWVNDEVYDKAVDLLDEIDRSAVDDGVPLTTEAGETVEELKDKRRNLERTFFLIALLVFFVFMLLMTIRF